MAESTIDNEMVNGVYILDERDEESIKKEITSINSTLQGEIASLRGSYTKRFEDIEKEIQINTKEKTHAHPNLTFIDSEGKTTIYNGSFSQTILMNNNKNSSTNGIRGSIWVTNQNGEPSENLLENDKLLIVKESDGHKIGDVCSYDGTQWSKVGNIRGKQGEQGVPGVDGKGLIQLYSFESESDLKSNIDLITAAIENGGIIFFSLMTTVTDSTYHGMMLIPPIGNSSVTEKSLIVGQNNNILKISFSGANSGSSLRIEVGNVYFKKVYFLSL